MCRLGPVQRDTFKGSQVQDHSSHEGVDLPALPLKLKRLGLSPSLKTPHSQKARSPQLRILSAAQDHVGHEDVVRASQHV